MKEARSPGGRESGPGNSNNLKQQDKPVLEFLQVTDRSLVEALRTIWWGQAALGNRMPAEPGVILIEGGRHG